MGVLPSFLHDPLGVLRRASALGDVSRLELGFIDAVTLHHPDHVDHVFRAHHRNYLKEGPFWEGVRMLLGNGLPTASGEGWLRHRRMMQPQFHRQRLAGLANAVVEVLDDSLAWDDVGSSWQTLDVGRRMPRVAMRVVLATLLGTQTSPARLETLGRETELAGEHAFRAMLAARLPSWLPVPGRGSFERSVSTLQREVRRIVDERRRESDEADDLLSLLITATDEDGAAMSTDQLVDETMSLLIAGYDTTASGLQWCLHLLAEHPEHLGRLREECDAVLRGRMPRPEDLRRLGYARWVMQEALRLYPPIWWLPRMAAEDDEIAGHRIAKGSIVAPVMYSVHRHPAFWPEPERFDPERFTPERSAGRHPLAWVPFGAGPRKCIGQELSLMESTLTLAMLTQRYELAASGHRVRPKVETVLRPADGVRLRIRQRPVARRAARLVPHASESSSAMSM